MTSRKLFMTITAFLTICTIAAAILLCSSKKHESSSPGAALAFKKNSAQVINADELRKLADSDIRIQTFSENNSAVYAAGGIDILAKIRATDPAENGSVSGNFLLNLDASQNGIDILNGKIETSSDRISVFFPEIDPKCYSFKAETINQMLSSKLPDNNISTSGSAISAPLLPEYLTDLAEIVSGQISDYNVTCQETQITPDKKDPSFDVVLYTFSPSVTDISSILEKYADYAGKNPGTGEKLNRLLLHITAFSPAVSDLKRILTMDPGLIRKNSRQLAKQLHEMDFCWKSAWNAETKSAYMCISFKDNDTDYLLEYTRNGGKQKAKLIFNSITADITAVCPSTAESITDVTPVDMTSSTYDEVSDVLHRYAEAVIVKLLNIQ
jgi:hypothetical protein